MNYKKMTDDDGIQIRVGALGPDVWGWSVSTCPPGGPHGKHEHAKGISSTRGVALRLAMDVGQTLAMNFGPPMGMPMPMPTGRPGLTEAEVEALIEGADNGTDDMTREEEEEAKEVAKLQAVLAEAKQDGATVVRP